MAVKGKLPIADATVSTGGSLISEEKLKQLYVSMLHCRLLTERARTLRAPGARIYAASMGQEAIATGFTIDLTPQDTIVAAPHDGIAHLVRGVPLVALVGELNQRPVPAVNGSRWDEALAKAQEQKRGINAGVMLAFASQAETRQDDWDHAIKFAAKRNLPIIFVIINNPWTGVPDAEDEDIALKAKGYGLTGITVDGNDVVAVYRVAHESLERVRRGDGPFLVEGRPYQNLSQPRLKKAQRDPLNHMEHYLTAKKLFSKRWKQKVEADFSRQLDAATKAARPPKN